MTTPAINPWLPQTCTHMNSYTYVHKQHQVRRSDIRSWVCKLSKITVGQKNHRFLFPKINLNTTFNILPVDGEPSSQFPANGCNDMLLPGQMWWAGLQRSLATFQPSSVLSSVRWQSFCATSLTSVIQALSDPLCISIHTSFRGHLMCKANDRFIFKGQLELYHLSNY